MTTYKTPGVYVEEVSSLPPSVAAVATAIPAFIGYTEKGTDVARVSSFREFEELFGGPQLAKFAVTTNEVAGTAGRILGSADFAESGKPGFMLYYALAHYFQNGGGRCYIVPIGDYEGSPSKDDFLNGLKRTALEDEPTLLVFPEAVRLNAADFADVCTAALKQCGELKDRFALLDVRADPTRPGDAANADDITAFRSAVGTEYLSYGAAYHPYLQTSLVYRYTPSDVSVDLGEEEVVGLDVDAIRVEQTMLANAIRAELATKRVTLPPSAAMAGVIARVDRDRGVWKAPGNVSLNGVIQPTVKITNADQADLNVDPTAGKSINAIRAFTGKGILAWGARTLAGNDNEWRYVNVRRLFVMIEESIEKSTGFAVFEANDATTWLKVKGMIEGFLYGLWERGALQGSAPEQAYQVRVGLGRTMTSQDVLEGRMIVEVGIAAVRPAEFIILRFEHMVAQA